MGTLGSWKLVGVWELRGIEELRRVGERTQGSWGAEGSWELTGLRNGIGELNRGVGELMGSQEEWGAKGVGSWWEFESRWEMRS